MPPGEDRQMPVAVVKAYDFVLWLIPKMERPPRPCRITVGERMVNLGLDLLLA